MIHYDPPRKAAQGAPPLCPKCGSHRTEIIGTNEDLTRLFVRCSACGHSATVPAGSIVPAR